MSLRCFNIMIEQMIGFFDACWGLFRGFSWALWLPLMVMQASACGEPCFRRRTWGTPTWNQCRTLGIVFKHTRTLLVVPGLTTRSKDATNGAPGIATSSILTTLNTFSQPKTTPILNSFAWERTLLPFFFEGLRHTHLLASQLRWRQFENKTYIYTLTVKPWGIMAHHGLIYLQHQNLLCLRGERNIIWLSHT